MTLAERIDRLDAYRQIRELAARYGRDLDARDMDGLLGLYVPEVRNTLRDAMVLPLRRVHLTILHVGTHVIDFQDEDNATGSVYCHGEIQNAEKNVPAATIAVAKKCRPGPTFFLPNSITPRKPASRKNADITS